MKLIVLRTAKIKIYFDMTITKSIYFLDKFYILFLYSF